MFCRETEEPGESDDSWDEDQQPVIRQIEYDPAAAPDTGVVALTRGGAGRVAGIRSNATGVTQPA